MRLALTLCTGLAATSAAAGVEEALTEHILPGYAAFAEKTAELSGETSEDCTPEAVKPAFNAAFDAWTRVGDIRIGPSETGALSVAFWPDSRGFTPRTLNRFISGEEARGTDAEAFAEASIAVRGLFALERMLYGEDLSDYAEGSYACTLVRTIAADLAGQAEALETGWREEFAPVLRSAGAPDNATYLTEEEAVRAIYTQVLTSLEFTADQRLGRPLGTFDRPRPERAEARRSGRPLRNVLRDAQGAVDLAKALADWELPETEAAMSRLREAAAQVSDPAFADLDDPSARLRVEIVQQHVRDVRRSIEEEIGVRLGLRPGFNSSDGD
ncbi:imelysin family protein [Salipiger mucosus]|uniref:Iron-regulated protein A n=1 Tax=Salipiger mucosus DSM 16094 TaxID=1123237 RepID=S9S4H4_9RHOB|nr:imelysin family protein [Salipiger mucosus]EPX85070.1 Iron-regulated protein A precursor [Salipiger mucosus DSM 16094]